MELNSPGLKLGVEEFMVEKTGVETWGLKFRGWNAVQPLSRPSDFLPILKKEHIYGYAIVQRPYYVPISSTSVHYGTNSVYMSCYGTINGDATHHYVNGDFLAEKLRIEETELEVFVLCLG